MCSPRWEGRFFCDRNGETPLPPGAGGACRVGGTLVSAVQSKPATANVKTANVRFMAHIIAHPRPPRKCGDFFPGRREIWYTIFVCVALEVGGMGEFPVNDRRKGMKRRMFKSSWVAVLIGGTVGYGT